MFNRALVILLKLVEIKLKRPRTESQDKIIKFTIALHME